jgi:DNA-binding transcriptional regulator LsrR (DeoR family)
MSEDEKRNIVCSLFCEEGLTAVQIKKRMKEEYGEEITREEPYQHLRAAAARGWIRFVPPLDLSLGQHVRSAHPWLQDAAVVPTGRTEDVAYGGAKMLLELLQQHHLDREVHIGFSGGTALRMLARRFAELLREPAQHLPPKIVFHAMVAGFDVTDPTTDPNAFFTFFVDDYGMPFEASFVALHSPATVAADEEQKLRKLPGIKEAYEHAPEIDIVVTSTSRWDDEHSMLRHHMRDARESEESVDELEEAKCLGDILWQPIGSDGPFELKTRIRAMTIMNLSGLTALIKEKKHVLLVAGPCHKCHQPKTEVVQAILDQKDPLITHLVTDSRCARELV